MIVSVRLENIIRQYDGTQFSLHIDKLEFHNRHIHVIVGPNGSGKTSLLKLIALLDRPDRGDILFNDKDVFPGNNGYAGLRKKTGFLMQNPYLFNADVFENVALGLKIRKCPYKQIDSRVTDILERLNIMHLAKRNVRYLSRGEYQKAAIAQVLVLEPEMILLDEPAANIDEQSMLSIEEIIKDIQKKSKSVIIMTTHSLAQAYRISTEVISIKDGKSTANNLDTSEDICQRTDSTK